MNLFVGINNNQISLLQLNSMLCQSFDLNENNYFNLLNDEIQMKTTSIISCKKMVMIASAMMKTVSEYRGSKFSVTSSPKYQM